MAGQKTGVLSKQQIAPFEGSVQASAPAAGLSDVWWPSCAVRSTSGSFQQILLGPQRNLALLSAVPRELHRLVAPFVPRGRRPDVHLPPAPGAVDVSVAP